MAQPNKPVQNFSSCPSGAVRNIVNKFLKHQELTWSSELQNTNITVYRTYTINQ